MSQVPSNLIPTRITQLPESPTASAEGYLIFVYEGRTYKIRAGDIVAGTIPDGSISAEKLAGGAATEAKIATGAVTTTKIATSAVTTTKIADGSVTPTKLSVSYARSGANSDITSLSGLVREDFTNAASTQPHLEGRVFYDNDSHSLAYYNEDPGVTVNIGREQLVRVYNNTGSALLNGKMVYINGVSGDWPTATLARADTAAASQSTLGMVTADISAGNYGYVCVSGVVNGLNTAAYPAGTRLYLSSASSGDWTTSPPLQPNYIVDIGTVVTSDTVTGRVFIRVDKSPWYPNTEIVDARPSITLPTAPQVFMPAIPSFNSSGFAYNSGTGDVTVGQNGSYSINIQFNAEPSASNKNIYFYVEESVNGGVTWTKPPYAGRQLSLQNSTETQVQVSASRYYAAGTKLRFYIWGDATVYLKTSYLPGVYPSGSVAKPAYRFLIA